LPINGFIFSNTKLSPMNGSEETSGAEKTMTSCEKAIRASRSFLVTIPPPLSVPILSAVINKLVIFFSPAIIRY
jgi:hypothetical protein